MQSRVCTILVLVSYSVFFTIFLLITNQSQLLSRIMGNNWVTLSRDLQKPSPFVLLDGASFCPLEENLSL